ncbi:unnamed protein product, partial [Pelagomonas calceolata]
LSTHGIAGASAAKGPITSQCQPRSAAARRWQDQRGSAGRSAAGEKASPTTPAFGASASDKAAIVPQWHTTAILLSAPRSARAHRSFTRASVAAALRRPSHRLLALASPAGSQCSDGAPTAASIVAVDRPWDGRSARSGSRSAARRPRFCLCTHQCSRAAAQTSHLLQLHAPSARAAVATQRSIGDTRIASSDQPAARSRHASACATPVAVSAGSSTSSPTLLVDSACRSSKTRSIVCGRTDASAASCVMIGCRRAFFRSIIARGART